MQKRESMIIILNMKLINFIIVSFKHNMEIAKLYPLMVSFFKLEISSFLIAIRNQHSQVVILAAKIVIPEYKVCISPYFTNDNENQCQNYKDFNLKLTKDDTIYISKNCEYGYFEFDGVCLQCPSIIKEGVITCYECQINPKNWYQNPTVIHHQFYR
ncbi:unnamed protein product (macronuclear) [Paramecium tetraurelia]|uniref:Tyrosine-protein kinase ephrin type A/B receptor-like domain-containing protein n=1 Tax=Paramecium tetraurelia TaxID=5888 RepID=A0EFM8_PARTE|nr:uncharacterized protein GSPATT00026442001 [Paramecium tetraurelia]CAK94119.1 unnamed protein product [Paramecium tetraurelia]|eukprot:XP_001461492.1 hypothetical protein (macronuclear) [Paramecium tetraurelia strain d4-2]